MRLIDADVFDKELEEYSDRHWDGEFYACEDIRSMLEDAPTVNPYEWISVEDRLPEKFTNVLCLYPSKSYGSNIVVDYMESDCGYFAEQFRYGEPTHWMPLPAPPTENK